MKVGRKPHEDLLRVARVREVIGTSAQLFVDANGAYSVKQALQFADAYAKLGVAWFEEPVSSDNLEGLRFIRERAPAEIQIAAGEYGYDLFYFRRMIEARAVDTIQVDVTRAEGVTGFMKASHLCDAFDIPLSAHTSPSIHAQLGCACLRLKHVEYFFDHVRIEKMFFEGLPALVDGKLVPDPSRPGLGLVFRSKEASRYAA
jgi:L-alanine-DL-glutamate epimerase-like enolase superfamily enzyme